MSKEIPQVMLDMIEYLNKCTKAYDEGNPIITDEQWDKLYFELEAFEKRIGVAAPHSPTQSIRYDVVNELEKIEHNHPMLSLPKTKEINDVISFGKGKKLICMEKLDGLTCSLRYVDGVLVSAETRGNGHVGENILHNIYHVKGVPHKIDFLGELVVDGEVICTTDDFKPWSDTYKNPRNFASGSIRLLDSQECAKRNLTFIAWDVIKGFENIEHLNIKLQTLKKYNFITVSYNTITSQKESVIEEVIELIKGYALEEGRPIDGIVFKFNNCKYYESLGATDHHFRGGLAFKFYDELYPTRLQYIDWTIGKSSQLTPTAVFDTVEIDGADVSRASLHNISIIKNLGLTNNCTVNVFKANQIIPQIDSCENDGNGDIEIPTTCPICSGTTVIKKDNESEVLVCTNQECTGKKLAQFTHFVSRKGMDIKNLSEATLELLISHGFIHNFKDIYHLSDVSGQLMCLDGLGKKSVEKLLNSIEDSRNVKLENFITALGIPEVGLSTAKAMASYCKNDIKKFINMGCGGRWNIIDGIGTNTDCQINVFMKDNLDEIIALADEMNFVVEEKTTVTNSALAGKNICVTGKLNNFTRDSINAAIESAGAKAVGSVSKTTDYLVTNEASGSSKYKKAVQLGITIINEEELMEMLN